MTIAVYQCGYAVFGLGETLAEAVDDANRWCDPAIEQAAVVKGGGQELDGCMYWLPCTDRLADEVRDVGGTFAYHMNEHGLLDLPDD